MAVVVAFYFGQSGQPIPANSSQSFLWPTSLQRQIFQAESQTQAKLIHVFTSENTFRIQFVWLTDSGLLGCFGSFAVGQNLCWKKFSCWELLVI
jgi:hypothetical protein